jgi:phosphatidylserine/phosphatidylglycerophosphate/cardiolipin synthase-like enzyme
LAEWENFREKIVRLQSDFSKFGIEFLDRDSFNNFCQRLFFDIKGSKEICITGYFSETIRGQLQDLQKIGSHVRLICPEFPVKSPRDRRNIAALRKLAESGVEIKFNNRMHARLLVAYTTYRNSKTSGQLILGSFDFNTECIGRERYDAGIRTHHSDLVQSAIDLFEKIWNDSESIDIEEFVKRKKK